MIRWESRQIWLFILLSALSWRWMSRQKRWHGFQMVSKREPSFNGLPVELSIVTKSSLARWIPYFHSIALLCFSRCQIKSTTFQLRNNPRVDWPQTPASTWRKKYFRPYANLFAVPSRAQWKTAEPRPLVTCTSLADVNKINEKCLPAGLSSRAKEIHFAQDFSIMLRALPPKCNKKTCPRKQNRTKKPGNLLFIRVKRQNESGFGE